MILTTRAQKLKRLHVASFPIQYPEAFYKQIIQQKNMGLSKVAYWRNNLVGAICTCLSEKDNADGKEAANSTPKLCILTLAVYAPYRGKGIGSGLLQTVLDYCPKKRISSVTLHVHVSNQGAIRFYTNRFGFETEAMIHNYYRRLVPRHCFKLCKKLLLDENTLTTLEEISTRNKSKRKQNEDESNA